MNIKTHTITIILILTLSTAFSQTNKEYKIDEIENWDKFEILTELESKHHRRNEESYKEIDHAYEVDSLFLPTVSDKEKKFLYEEYELKTRISYKENRSRCFINFVKYDSIIQGKTYTKPDTISTDCVCELKNDTIQISMGLWVFGGFFYNIKIFKDTYELTYIKDAHEIKPYKYNKADTIFTETLEMKIFNSDLIFDEKIENQVGKKINGYLRFESPIYYIDSHYNYGGQPWNESVDKMVTKGKIFFTCRLREPFKPPKE